MNQMVKTVYNNDHVENYDSPSKIEKIFLKIQSSPWISAKIRRYILAAFGAELHSTSVVMDGLRLTTAKALKMEADAYISHHGYIDGYAPLRLAAGVRIGAYARIMTGAHSISTSMNRRDVTGATDRHKPVSIGRGTWVGTNVTILGGVVVGEGCVIAADSTVTRDLEPNGLYANGTSPSGLTRAVKVRDLPVS